MQKLTLFMLIVATTFEFFTRGDDWGRWAILPGGFQYSPELLSMIAAIIVVVAGTRNRFQYVRAEYWVVFGALVVTIIAGALVNSVGAGPIFGGARNYLRAIPWFFIPAVIAFTDDQIKTQLKLLLAIALLQVPLAIQQRLATAAQQGSFTGDKTSGTLLISSIMSIFLIGAICVAAALFVRGRLKAWQFILLFVLLLLPTTVNETKGTLILLPVGLLVAFFVASRQRRRLRLVLLASALVSGFAAIYFPIYDYYNLEKQYAKPLGEMLTDSEWLRNYLWKTEDIGAEGQVGRIDSIVVPFKRMMHDPTRLAFGFGIGNVSDSSLGPGFVGAQFGTYGAYLVTAIGRILLELGMLGVALVLALMWLIYKDCQVVCRQGDDERSTLAAGWAGVTVLIAIALFYKDMIGQASLSYLFWYFSGVIAATRMRNLAAA